MVATIIKYLLLILDAYSIARTGNTLPAMAARDLNWYAGYTGDTFKRDVIYLLKDTIIEYFGSCRIEPVKIEYPCDHRRKRRGYCPDCIGTGVFSTRYFLARSIVIEQHLTLRWLSPTMYTAYVKDQWQTIKQPSRHLVPTKDYEANILTVWVWLKLRGVAPVPLVDIFDTFWDWRHMVHQIRKLDIKKNLWRLLPFGAKRCSYCGKPYMKRGKLLVGYGTCECVPF